MTRTFFILAYPRTGSYALSSMLHSAEDIVCHGEIFKRDTIELRPWHRTRLGDISPLERDREPINYIKKLRQLNPHKIFGFKIFSEHLSRIGAREQLLHSSEWKKIVLVRDPIEVYASLLRARETGVWVLPKHRKETPGDLQRQVKFDEKSWSQFLASYEEFLIDGRNCANAIKIQYKEINDLQKIGEVLDFLGSNTSPSALRASYRKQFTKGPIETAFSNWPEFSDYLSQRGWLRTSNGKTAE